MIDWLNSGDGQDLVHAVIGLLVAVAAFYSYKAHSHTKRRGK